MSPQNYQEHKFSDEEQRGKYIFSADLSVGTCRTFQAFLRHHTHGEGTAFIYSLLQIIRLHKD